MALTRLVRIVSEGMLSAEQWEDYCGTDGYL